MSSENFQSLSEALPTSAVGKTLFHFETVDSTNQWLRDRSEALPHGSVAIADFQSAGRGRLGRQWVTPPGAALLHSILLKPNWPLIQASWLTMIAGIVVVDAIKTLYDFDVKLKWPNDVVALQDQALHKIGGILVETTVNQARLAEAVIGIGLNVNISAGDLPTTQGLPASSLLLLTGQQHPRTAVAYETLSRIERAFEHSAKGNSPLEAWRDKLITLGEKVTVVSQIDRAEREGRAIDVDEWGRLIIEDQQGRRQAVAAGDVSLRF
ncbi:MAG: biotin--[acetyl-CoA-carboxylase] ligase [Chloroflexota bacterium]